MLRLKRRSPHRWLEAAVLHREAKRLISGADTVGLEEAQPEHWEQGNDRPGSKATPADQRHSADEQDQQHQELIAALQRELGLTE